MIKPFTLSILACILLLTASVATAESLRIVTIALPPYGYIENGIETGLTYELGNRIAQEAGLDPINNILPFARSMEEVVSGTADMVIMFPNQTINANAKNLGSILPMETVIFGRADSTYRSLKDLHGKTIASVRGAEYDDRITKKNGMILYLTDNYTQSLKMLLAGRVEAVIGPKLGLYYTARKNKYPKHAFGTPLVLSTRQGCVFISNKAPETLAKKILDAMDRIRKNGTVTMLLEKYSL